MVSGRLAAFCSGLANGYLNICHTFRMRAVRAWHWSTSMGVPPLGFCQCYRLIRAQCCAMNGDEWKELASSALVTWLSYYIFLEMETKTDFGVELC